jgi:SMC interacting uncharacterized protein involved in chromosome segregation
MGIQDSIFDLEADLEHLGAGEHTKECFDEIIAFIGRLETENEQLLRFYHSANELANAIDQIREKKSVDIEDDLI